MKNMSQENISRSMKKPEVHMNSPRLRQITMRDLTPLIRSRADLDQREETSKDWSPDRLWGNRRGHRVIHTPIETSWKG